MSTKTNQKTTPKISSLVRHRKVIRDSIQGITKPAIARICQTAGVKRISGYLYEELRGVLLTEVRKLLIPSIAFMQHSRRRTVQKGDLSAALQSSGYYLGVGSNPNTVKTFTTRKTRQRGLKSHTTDKNPHKFRPGTVALQEIRYQQKHSDQLAIPRVNFSRVVIEVGQDEVMDLRYSASFMEIFQYVIEDRLIKIMRGALLVAIHTHRQTVMQVDVQLARRLSNDQF